MLTEAPRCQGDARVAAEEYLKGALAYYRDAREAIADGAVGPAYTKLRRVAGFLALQAQKLAESCASGQAALGLDTQINVEPSEEALLESDEHHEPADDDDDDDDAN